MVHFHSIYQPIRNFLSFSKTLKSVCPKPAHLSQFQSVESVPEAQTCDVITYIKAGLWWQPFVHMKAMFVCWYFYFLLLCTYLVGIIKLQSNIRNHGVCILTPKIYKTWSMRWITALQLGMSNFTMEEHCIVLW